MTSRSVKGYRVKQKMVDGKLVITEEKIPRWKRQALESKRQRKSKKMRVQRPQLLGLFSPGQEGGRGMSTVAQYIAERNAALESDDFEWFRQQAIVETGKDVSPTVCVMAFHMARYLCREISTFKRRASQKWLAEQNVKDMGQPIRKGDPLP